MPPRVSRTAWFRCAPSMKERTLERRRLFLPFGRAGPLSGGANPAIRPLRHGCSISRGVVLSGFHLLCSPACGFPSFSHHGLSIVSYHPHAVVHHKRWNTLGGGAKEARALSRRYSNSLALASSRAAGLSFVGYTLSPKIADEEMRCGAPSHESMGYPSARVCSVSLIVCPPRRMEYASVSMIAVVPCGRASSSGESFKKLSGLVYSRIR